MPDTPAAAPVKRALKYRKRRVDVMTIVRFNPPLVIRFD